MGSSDPSAPWTPWLAAAGTVLGGSAALAVTLLFLLALPLAGLSAYLSARVLRVGPGVRALAALTYALLGGLPQAVAGGRFDVVVAIVAIPPLLAAGTRLLSEDPARVGWRRDFGAGTGGARGRLAHRAQGRATRTSGFWAPCPPRTPRSRPTSRASWPLNNTSFLPRSCLPWPTRWTTSIKSSLPPSREAVLCLIRRH